MILVVRGADDGAKTFIMEKNGWAGTFFLQQQMTGQGLFIEKKMTGQALFFGEKMTGRGLFLRPKKSSCPQYLPIHFAPSLRDQPKFIWYPRWVFGIWTGKKSLSPLLFF